MSRSRLRMVVPLLVGAFAAVLALAGPSSPVSAQEILPPGRVTELVVDTATGVYPFMVELADDPRERGQGLMYRRELPPDRGMLFDMGGTGPAGFWMKNTYVSLDIIFIGPDGRVVNVAEATEPLSEDVVSAAGPTRFVLELLAGTARRIGLAPGDRIRHPVIDAVAGG